MCFSYTMAINNDYVSTMYLQWIKFMLVAADDGNVFGLSAEPEFKTVPLLRSDKLIPPI